ncbi:cilia- and flagella-associated protein 157 [Hyla sarda]|uniref:cilia- and flagella-associated protein 157 n=1 Tax=Hyla sarda TaxID=327740 RepID=UPI0024C3CC01|nr:cilia- and flagella-associated protein 157 [Hyla sarda]XP_056393725.1 cilia- and flagella-associated protein 157 [Hyla sarda]
MPPKKKKGKGSAAGKKEKPAEKAKADPVSEESKEHYLLQIRDLEGRLDRYQKKWDEICAKENFYQTQFDQLSSDKKEIVSFLKHTLNQRMDEIADLNDQLTGLQQAKEAEKDAYETQLAQMRHQFQETKEQLTSENMLLAGKLASLEEFRVQKEDLMAKFAALEEKLRKQEEEHKDMMYKLEKKAVLDKDRLKKEMVQRVNTVAAEFRRVSNDQMAETSKRAIRENVAISSQLAKMSEKSLELIQENDELKEQELELRKKLEMLEENEKEFVKNNLSNQKLIHMLTEKCHQQQKMLDLAMEKEQELNELHMEHRSLQEEEQALRQRVMSLEEERQRLMDGMNKADQQLEEEVKKKQSVERVLGQAASSLKDLLMEKSSDGEDDQQVDSIARQNQMLHSLLVLLNSAAALGLGPALSEFQSRDTFYVEQHMPPKGHRRTVSPTLKGPGVIPHYQMGDLGLVPRQDVSNAILSKIGMLSRTTKLGPIQANPALAKDLLTLSQDGKLPKQKALPGISSTSTSNGLLMAK